MAEDYAKYAYYFLVLGVALRFLEFTVPGKVRSGVVKGIEGFWKKGMGDIVVREALAPEIYIYDVLNIWRSYEDGFAVRLYFFNWLHGGYVGGRTLIINKWLISSASIDLNQKRMILYLNENRN